MKTIKIDTELEEALDKFEGTWSDKIKKYAGTHSKVYLTKEEIESLIDQKIESAKGGY